MNHTPNLSNEILVSNSMVILAMYNGNKVIWEKTQKEFNKIWVFCDEIRTKRIRKEMPINHG